MMNLDAFIEFAYEAGHLKSTPRSGWLRAGITNPENVAAHSWRVAVIGYMLAHEEHADPERTAVLGLFHDFPETRVGDVGAVSKGYVACTDPVDIAEDQVHGLPVELGRHIVELVREHESAKTAEASREALCSRDADKIDCLLQARSYEQAGNRMMHTWVDDMAHAVKTTTGKALAERAREADPSAWWLRTQ